MTGDAATETQRDEVGARDYTNAGYPGISDGWRFKQAAIQGGLFAVKWGLAVVLLGIVVRVTLTEILVPPIYRLVRDDIAAAKEQGKAGGHAAGYLQIAIERGLLPDAQKLGQLPKATWTNMATGSTTSVAPFQAPEAQKKE